MALDTDIQNASASDLEKIKAQDWRNDAKARREFDVNREAAWEKFEERRTVAIEKQTNLQVGITNDFLLEDVNRLVFTLAANYLKPSTATTPEGRAADVEKDGEFLLLAVKKAIAIRDAILAEQSAK